MLFFSGFYSHCSFSFIFLFFKNNSNFFILKLKDKKCFNFKINRLYKFNVDKQFIKLIFKILIQLF